MKGELEKAVQLVEESKLELATTQGILENTIETHRATSAEKGAVVKNLENKVQELKVDSNHPGLPLTPNLTSYLDKCLKVISVYLLELDYNLRHLVFVG